MKSLKNSYQAKKNYRSVKKISDNEYVFKKYEIHYENLKRCLSLELKLEKIHRVLEFNQSQ